METCSLARPLSPHACIIVDPLPALRSPQQASGALCLHIGHLSCLLARVSCCAPRPAPLVTSSAPLAYLSAQINACLLAPLTASWHLSLSHCLVSPQTAPGPLGLLLCSLARPNSLAHGPLVCPWFNESIPYSFGWLLGPWACLSVSQSLVSSYCPAVQL